MTISMHSASAPIFLTMLGNLSTWLDKAAAHAEARRFDPQVLMNARLAPDMLPFVKQVQIACDAAKLGLARLAGIDAPRFDDSEATLGELRQRIDATCEFLRGVRPEQVDGSEERAVSVPMRNRDPLAFRGEDYLRQFALPNFFFHVTTAYAILRHNGVQLGKADFLGGR